MKIVLIDNQDSFVYNLVDALHGPGRELVVYRNTVPVETVLAAAPDIIVLSPGPSHPRDAGEMMNLIEQTIGKIPLLGVCLGFQALIEHFGGEVAPVGPVHGVTDCMSITTSGMLSGLFRGLTVDEPVPGTDGSLVPVARYHSLGCVHPPSQLVNLATIQADAGEICMAALWPGDPAAELPARAIGVQFHPESILSPTGPYLLDRCLNYLTETTTPETEK